MYTSSSFRANCTKVDNFVKCRVQPVRQFPAFGRAVCKGRRNTCLYIVKHCHGPGGSTVLLTTADPAEAERICHLCLPPYTIPRRILRVPALPLTPTAKPNRPAALRLAQSHI